ncbi:hypothetical protein JD844_033818 [Phrynosoma platyrhinos]|uniref:Hemopexin n=1 Tax=Phrynosoma platyrhinos TaxID=52577 RepID=A0ABQ7T718_PHRPL|nr:hypothetical protein JD844_033818 [Phrynosoma platyrhinos]
MERRCGEEGFDAITLDENGAMLFFQGSTILAYDLKTKEVKRRNWPAVANCSAAIRWQERYYCFQGVRFLRFDPVTGHVPPNYPRDARNYFMACPGVGEWLFSFHTPEGALGPDSAHSYGPSGSQVSIYLAEQGYRRVEGYPRPVQEELGVSRADATFTCPQSKDLYVIQENQLHHVDLTQSPRRPDSSILIPHDRVDSALCTNKGLFLFHGADVYHYTDVAQLRAAKAPAPAQNIAITFLKCPAAPESTGVHEGPKRPPH